MEVPVEMQRFKYIIVSSAVALALTAANLSAQQSPSRPGAGGSGGAGDASASNQSSQIALETKIATGTVGIATGIHSISQLIPSLATSAVLDAANTTKIATGTVGIATGINAMAEVHSRIATSVVYMALNGVSISPTVATSLVAIATGTDGQKKVQADIATSVVKLAGTGLTTDPAIATSLVAMIAFQDGLEGLITSSNTYLLPIATSAVAIATGTHRMSQIHPDIATSTVFSAVQALRIATSDVAIATGINAMAAVHSAIATSVVKIAQAGASTDTELSAAATPANGSTPPLTSSLWNYNMIYRSDQGRWFYGEAASSSTGISDAGTSRVVEASNSPVATSAVAIATGIDGMKAVQANIATAVVSLASIIKTEQIFCPSTIAIATTATNYRQVIPAGAGNLIYICSELWTVTQGALVSFGYGGGTNCDSGPVDMTGEMSVAASSGAARGSGSGVLYAVPVGKAFCVRIATASGGAAIGGSLSYLKR